MVRNQLVDLYFSQTVHLSYPMLVSFSSNQTTYPLLLLQLAHLRRTKPVSFDGQRRCHLMVPQLVCQQYLQNCILLVSDFGSTTGGPALTFRPSQCLRSLFLISLLPLPDLPYILLKVSRPRVGRCCTRISESLLSNRSRPVVYSRYMTGELVRGRARG